eukprot:scaffold2231_cov18-Tisochrysis_lutea.AAC.3
MPAWAHPCIRTLFPSHWLQIHIAEFKERRRPAKDYIHAQILVERESQVCMCAAATAAAAVAVAMILI